MFSVAATLVAATRLKPLIIFGLWINLSFICKLLQVGSTKEYKKSFDFFVTV